MAHYTQTDQVKAAITQGALRAFVDGANVAATGEPPTYTLERRAGRGRLALTTIQYVTPGLLGWAIAMSAAFGAAATLQGWRQSKLLRRLQLAPVSTRTVVGARVAVTVAIALVQMAIFLGLGAAAFGLRLTGSWWAAVPLLVVGHAVLHGGGPVRRRGHQDTSRARSTWRTSWCCRWRSWAARSSRSTPPRPGCRRSRTCCPLHWLNEGMLDVMVRGEGPAAVLLPMAVLAASRPC